MIRTRRDGAVLTIAFDRADARNAITAAGWDALAEAVEDAAQSDAAAVVIASAVDGIFSAGADLTMLAGLHADPAARAPFRTRMARAVEGIARLPMPVVAAVSGGCYGAAVAIVLACDIVVAGDAAVFAVTPAKLGIGYPGSDVARLIARVGRGQAARMLFSADTLDVSEALRIGLVDLHASDADALAAQIAANSGDAVRLLKRTIADPAGADAGFDAAFGGRDFPDRLAAFRARAR